MMNRLIIDDELRTGRRSGSFPASSTKTGATSLGGDRLGWLVNWTVTTWTQASCRRSD